MAREPLSDVPLAHRPGTSHGQRVGEHTRRILNSVRARSYASLEMDDETPEAIMRKLGERHD